MQHPDEFTHRCIYAIESRYKITFVFTIMVGLCCHLYQLTNKFFNYDELALTPSGYGAGYGVGRWGLELFAGFVHEFFGNYSLPMVSGLITIILISFSACFLVAIFDIQDKVLCGLLGGLCISFPAVTCALFNMYFAPYYGLSLLLCVLSVYFVVEKKHRILFYAIAIALLTLAIGIYQACFPVAVCAVMIYLIIECYTDKEKNNYLVRHTVAFLLYLVFSLVCYMIINKIVLAYYDFSLVSYQGVDKMGEISLEQFLSGISDCFILYFSLMLRKDVIQLNPTIFTKLTFILLNIAILCIITLNLLEQKKKKFTRILMIFTVCLFPIGVFLIFLMAPDAYVYAIMVYPCVFIFALPIVLCDQSIRNTAIRLWKTRINNILTWVITISCSVSILVYIWFANGNYQALQYTNYHDIAYYTVMMTQIKSTEGYDPETPVIFIGDVTKLNDVTNGAGALLEKQFNLSGKSPSNVSAYSSKNILSRYLGFTPVTMSYEDSETFKKNEAIKDMPCYPLDGSITMIDDVVVIKLAEE